MGHFPLTCTICQQAVLVHAQMENLSKQFERRLATADRVLAFMAACDRAHGPHGPKFIIETRRTKR